METQLTWKDVDAHTATLAAQLEEAERNCVVAQRELDAATANRDKIKREHEAYTTFLNTLTSL